MENKSKWPYMVIVVSGIVMFCCAIGFLVAMTRATGSGQYYWAFNAVIAICALSLLMSIFATKQ